MQKKGKTLIFLMSTIICIVCGPTGPTFVYAAGTELSSGPETEMSLENFIKTAMQKNPGLMEKKARYESLRGKVIGAWLPSDPMAGVTSEGQSKLFDAGSRADNMYMVSQTIPFPTKLFLSGIVASKEADMAYQMYKEEERAVAWRIEQPAYQLYLSNGTLAALEENKGLLNQFSNVVKARYESGATSQSDYLKVQIEFAQITIELFDWQQKKLIAEAGISRELNRALDTHYPIEEKTVRPVMALSLPELEKIALDKRSELQSFKIALERAKAAGALAKTDWLPDLTGKIEAIQTKGESGIDKYNDFIGVSVPVWSLLKGIGGGWRSADEDIRAAELLYTDMKNEVLFKVREAYAKFLSGQNALNTYESTILPQAKQQVDISLSSYEAGKVDALSLIDAERTLKNNQIAYYKARADYEMALSGLRLAAGDDLNQRSNLK